MILLNNSDILLFRIFFFDSQLYCIEEPYRRQCTCLIIYGMQHLVWKHHLLDMYFHPLPYKQR